ncbi:MAG: GNAT family N-acetyltransferase [Planctomycetota bacterium]|nr:GNAT family N-acetyltransferase [Planctomycetota bacterium]
MPQSAPAASVADLGRSAGRIAERHIDLAFRRILRGPNVDATARFIRLVTGAAHPFGNFVLFSAWGDETAVDAAIEPLTRCGAPSAVLFTGAIGEGVKRRLQDRGFGLHESMPAMVVDIERLRETAPPPGYAMERVGGGSAGDAWARAFAEGYEVPIEVGDAFSPNGAGLTTAAEGPLQYFAIRRGDRMVCTSILFLAEGVAGIYGVSTVPDERGKGLAAHATAAALRSALELGHRVGVLQSSPAGHSVYRGLGFVDVGDVPLFVRVC